QDAIDGAQRWVNTIVNLTVKASLQADVDKAQGLLNAKLAEEKAYQDKARQEVNALFTDNNPSSNAIKGPTNQDAIDGAQRWVNTIVNLTVKASLQADVDKAQGLLNAKLAEEKNQEAAAKAVNELFKNDTSSSNEIKGITDQKAIDTVKALIDTVKDADKKASLQADLNKAQGLLDAKLAEEKKQEEVARQLAAEKAVNELFTNDTISSDEIKGTTDQKAIDTAKALIDTVK
ncbi:toxin Cry1Ac domain D-VI-related protein, partial [Carnobacterium maltaromaticum]|uniref:toxin Cry1Ac domain D-VI-related protein n=1 Tax=Carnobacterium maltaromaticum TaxID=2751 RepID=UPI00295EECEB